MWCLYLFFSPPCDRFLGSFAHLSQMGMGVATKCIEKVIKVWNEDKTLLNFALSKGTKDLLMTKKRKRIKQ